MFVRRRMIRDREVEVRAAVVASFSYAETLRRLGYCPTGGNWLTLKKYLRIWGIPTDHFDRDASQRNRAWASRTPLEEILVENSPYSRTDVKRRLLRDGIKEQRCELCGQNEVWRGKKMSMILDHINGVRDDHRLENLRMICPNCAATLDTHCGRKNSLERPKRQCRRCGETFEAQRPEQRYCSRACGSRYPRSREPRPETRKVDRPPYEQLLAEIEATSYLAVGRKYGVSDNAVRKWVKWYERQAERERRHADVRVLPRAT
jgi:hypothetical protein